MGGVSQVVEVLRVLCALCFVLCALCFVLCASCFVLRASCFVLCAWCLVLGPWSVVDHGRALRLQHDLSIGCRCAASGAPAALSLVRRPWSIMKRRFGSSHDLSVHCECAALDPCSAPTPSSTTDDGRRTTDHGPRTTDHGPRTTDQGPRTTDQGLRTRRSRKTKDGGEAARLLQLDNAKKNCYRMVMSASSTSQSRVREEVLRDGKYPVHKIADELLPYLNVLVEQFHPDRVILFGSYAYGRPTPDSDVDLLVVKDIDGSPVAEATRIRRAVRHLRHSVSNLPLDIMVRDRKDLDARLAQGADFHEEIIRKGLVIV